MILHISHGARRSDNHSDVDWFIVHPLEGQPHVDAVNSLISARRKVIEIDLDANTMMVMPMMAIRERQI